MTNGVLDRETTWDETDALAAAVDLRFVGLGRQRWFDYVHPLHLQGATPAETRRTVTIPVSYVEWGAPDAPAVVCVGGVANTARRFDFLAAALHDRYRVVAMDWLGRGRSGWLPYQSDYSFETNVEQLTQALDVLGLQDSVLVGSSLGGLVGLALTQRNPGAFRAIVLNDIGPFLPRTRRIRRAATLARHYVFRTPCDLLRRVGASQRNDGPLDPAIVLHNCYHLTRWSDDEGGRIYRHDLRSLQVYQFEAVRDVDLWPAWSRLTAPVLVLHGTESDALLPATLERMRLRPRTWGLHVQETGHTPALAEPNQIAAIRCWLDEAEAIVDGATIIPAVPGSYSVL